MELHRNLSHPTPVQVCCLLFLNVLMMSVQSVSICPITSAVCRNKEHILSDNKVLRLMPWHRCGVAHKPVVADFCSYYDHRGSGEESSSSHSSSVAAPLIRYDFLCCGGAANKFQVLLQAWENRYRNTHNA